MARKRKPASAKARTERLFLRMEPELLARIEGHTKRMEATFPGVGYTKSDAVRSLIYRGLELYEEEEMEDEEDDDE